MSAPPRIGTARGDAAVYFGRTCVGYLRGSVAGVTAYKVDGTKIGSFASQKLARDALLQPRGPS